MKIFSADALDGLTQQARAAPRRRQHRNIHRDYQDVCQRLFNAIEPDSYIRPHRHAVPGDELLMAIRGLMALVTFDERGRVVGIIRFGSEKYGSAVAAGVEVGPDTWHTVLALEPGSVLFEVKAGPFEPARPKQLAAWAPAEASAQAPGYLRELEQLVRAGAPAAPGDARSRACV